MVSPDGLFSEEELRFTGWFIRSLCPMEQRNSCIQGENPDAIIISDVRLLIEVGWYKKSISSSLYT